MKGPMRIRLAEPLGGASRPDPAGARFVGAPGNRSATPAAASEGELGNASENVLQDVAGNVSEDVSNVRAIYRLHARFVWLSLQRLGVQPSDLDDVAQDVFVIVHRRLDTFDRRARVTTWLFGICMRVAANYRRRRRWTRELLSGWAEDDRPALLIAADDVLVRREEREIAERALDRLDVAKRATFVMFEIESLSCLEISELMNVPIGTVYSRLHGARRQLEKTIARELKRRHSK
jgi:RNA polymerase sigma-70 factor (ECF subfamily)